MIKKSILYFIPCILSLTFVCGCINYTNTETKDSVHTLVIEEIQEKKSIEGVSKIGTPSFFITKFITKPLLSQARALVYPKVFVSLGIQKIHYAKDTADSAEAVPS